MHFINGIRKTNVHEFQWGHLVYKSIMFSMELFGQTFTYGDIFVIMILAIGDGRLQYCQTLSPKSVDVGLKCVEHCNNNKDT